MEAPIHPKSIVILDFGGQYAHLIANRVRRLGAYSEIRPPETPAAELAGAAGIILSGGPQSVYADGSPQADQEIFALGLPILGLCYGHQWLAHVLGGAVHSAGSRKEYGHTPVRIVAPDNPLVAGLPDSFSVWMSHGDEVQTLPPGFRIVASTDTCPNAAMADEARRIFGVQFHIEVTHSQHGMDILERFVGLCDTAPWSVENFSDHIGAQVKAEVGDRKVFMLVSGGVDSTVAFTLLSEVLGPDRVQGLLVDTGLMRKDEVRQIQTALNALTLPNLHVEDASEEFLAALAGVTEPEAKRRSIGNTFLAVQKRVSEAMGLRTEDGWMLGQGTIYPDTIETGGTKHADHIKTHHNRVQAIQEMMDRGLVIEPLKELYKDEVRMLGEEIGLPHALVWRHPFPGPGLGVRILCAHEEHREEWKADSEIAVPHVVLPVQSVGVQGDERTYRHALALFAADPLTVTDEHWRLATTVPNAHSAINRVLLCTSHSMPMDLHVVPGGITRERADLLREADAIVDDAMRQFDLYERIWQFPVVLIPCGTDGGESIVLRPVESQEAMTANAALLPRAFLRTVTDRLLALPGIDAVFYDLTSKPPGTIEWE